MALPARRRAPRPATVIAVLVIGGAVAIVAIWLAPRLGVPTRFWSSPIETVTLDGRALRVVAVGYAQGLRGVDTLGDLDGALFALDRVAGTDTGMGMFDTRMPLDVVFFDADGRFIDRFTMPVCPTDRCETYYPGRPWRYAIEGPAGSLAWVSDAATLVRGSHRP